MALKDPPFGRGCFANNVTSYGIFKHLDRLSCGIFFVRPPLRKRRGYGTVRSTASDPLEQWYTISSQVLKCEGNNFRVIDHLMVIARTSRDTETLAVACHDLGEFARLHPVGRRLPWPRRFISSHNNLLQSRRWEPSTRPAAMRLQKVVVTPLNMLSQQCLQKLMPIIFCRNFL